MLAVAQPPAHAHAASRLTSTAHQHPPDVHLPAGLLQAPSQTQIHAQLHLRTPPPHICMGPPHLARGCMTPQE
eukprot:350735-Chlamydomonas_euryale.AAC.3